MPNPPELAKPPKFTNTVNMIFWQVPTKPAPHNLQSPQSVERDSIPVNAIFFKSKFSSNSKLNFKYSNSYIEVQICKQASMDMGDFNSLHNFELKYLGF